MEYNNPLAGKLQFILDNLEAANAVYENLGYIQGYMEGSKDKFEKSVNTAYQEPILSEPPEWVKEQIAQQRKIQAVSEPYDISNDREYWQKVEKEQAEGMEVKEEDGDK